MNANEFKRWLAAHGCTFETKRSGSGHIVVRRGDRIALGRDVAFEAKPEPAAAAG